MTLTTMAWELVIVGAKTATLLLGGSITYFAYKAFSRTGDPALRALAIGFGIVTLGALLGGFLDRIIGLEAGVATSSVLTAAGFAVITYSLYVE